MNTKKEIMAYIESKVFSVKDTRENVLIPEFSAVSFDVIETAMSNILIDEQAQECYKLLNLAQKQLNATQQILNLLGIDLHIQPIKQETVDKIYKYVDENDTALFEIKNKLQCKKN